MRRIYNIIKLHKETRPKAGKQITYILLLGLLLSYFEVRATSQLLRGNETKTFFFLKS